MAQVLVIGQGYVGLPLAMCAVSVGHVVVGYDRDEARVKRLLEADSFVEDVPSTVLSDALASGRYRVSSSPSACEGFDVAVITVPTPLREGVPDLSFIEGASREVAPFVRPGCLVVLESTTYPGTTEELVVPILEAGSGLRAGVDFSVGYSPERIDPGNRTWTFERTPKVVSGIDDASLQAVIAFYRPMVANVVPTKGCKEAELTKLLENTFRHVNVALVNELAQFASGLGIDIWDAIDAASSKPFGFMRFTPGPGVGGHCLPIDPSYLSWRVHQSLGKVFRFVELANDVNRQMPDYVVQRIMLAMNERSRALRGARILCLGLAYKPNSSDARESPAVEVVNRLVALGARVAVADPHVRENPPHLAEVERVDLDRGAVRSAEAVVLLTDHDRFDYELVAREAAYVFDARRRLARAPNIEHL